MDREITVALTPRVVGKSAYYQCRNLFVLSGLLLLLNLYTAYLEYSHTGRIYWRSHWLLFVFVVYAIVLAVAIYLKTMGRIRETKTQIVRYRIKDDGFYIQTDIASGRNSWDSFKGGRKYRDIWHLVPQSGNVFILPVEQLDEELKTFILNKVPLDGASNKSLKILVGWFLAFIVVLYLSRRFQKPHVVIPVDKALGTTTEQK